MENHHKSPLMYPFSNQPKKNCPLTYITYSKASSVRRRQTPGHPDINSSAKARGSRPKRHCHSPTPSATPVDGGAQWEAKATLATLATLATSKIWQQQIPDVEN
jgi:hypothetical protein